MRGKRILLVIGLLLILGLLAACGRGAAQPTATTVPPTEAPPTEAPAAEIMPVKLGVMVPLTGPLSEFGGNFQKAVELAQKELAAAGYQVELKIGDTETSAIPAVDTARRLVEVEGVQALIGAASSGVTIPIAESVTIPNQVPQISNASTSPLITDLPADSGKDFLFRTAPSDALQGVVLAGLAEAEGFNSVSVLYVNNPYGQGLNDVFKANFEKAGGKVPASVPVPEEAAPTYTAELQKAAEGNPQALIALAYPGQATVFLREALEGDFFKQFLFVDGTKSQDIVTAVGADALNGMCGTAPGSAETPSLDMFNQAYNAEYGQVPPLPFMTNIYDGAVIAALAAYEAQVQGEALTPVAVRDHLRSVANPPGEKVTPGVEGLTKAIQLLSEGKQINYEGAAGTDDFDDHGDVETPIEVWCYENGQIVSKEFVTPGEKVTPPEVAKPSAGKPAAEVKACEVTDVGGIDDKSFNATAWKGVQDAMDQLGVQGQYLESQEQADYTKNIQEFLDGNCDLIVTVGFLLGDATKEAANANPDQKFAIVDYAYAPGDIENNNVLGLTFQTQEAAFLAGYVAAGMTKTGTVATFGGINIPPVTVFMDGFAWGVDYYNQQKGTDVKVLGWDPARQEGTFTGNFESLDDGRTYAESFFDEGADIILPVAGPVGLGSAAAAQERGLMLIGVDTDWYVSAPEYQNVELTSVKKNMDVAVLDAIKAVIDGTFKGGVYVGTLANDGVGIAPYHDFDGQVPDELKQEVEQVRQGIIDGSIKVGQ